MKFTLVGHEKKYEVEQTAMLFFENDSDAEIISTLSEQDGVLFATAKVLYNGKEAEYTETLKRETILLENKNLIKRSVYGAAKQISENRAPWGILTGVRPVKPVKDMLAKGRADEEIKKILKEEYLVSDEKIVLATDIAKREIELVNNAPDSVSIYVNIPFCPTRCLYCSFVSATLNKKKDISADYVECIKKEMQLTAQIIKDKKLKIDGIYVGGGTPTTLEPHLLQSLLSAINENFDAKNVKEYTVEAGRPDTITKEKLQMLFDSNVTRISINSQSLNDTTLKIIGRNHTASEFLNAFAMAREAGFDNINTDIIAGLPGEDEGMFCKTLEGIEKLSPESLAVHTLCIKRSAYLKHAQITLPDSKTVCNMLSAAKSSAENMNMHPYYMYKQRSTLGNLENVGYSKRGKECVYNINTMGDIQTVLAVGAGGVTKILKGNKLERVFNYKNPDEYIKNPEEMIKRKEALYDLI